MTETPPPDHALNDGRTIAPIGLGTWPLDDDAAETAVAGALGLGYRLVDTALNYRNEAGTGRGIARSGVPREDVYVTTKVPGRHHGYAETLASFEESRSNLGLHYVDLYLIHWPNPRRDRYVDAWRGLARLLDEGLVRAIGVSNFKPAHLDRVLEETGVVPDVNQIELNPYVTRTGPRAHHAEHGILTQSYSPLDKGGALLEEAVVREAADRHGRTPAQIVLRWHVQLGLLAVAKSSDPVRQAQNLALFDFELSEDEMAGLSALERGEAAATDSDTFGH
jgi:2,5-diketo-D-gluconate reductase A